jgi:hypothetical protein
MSGIIPDYLYVVAPIAPNTGKDGFEEFAVGIDATLDCPVRSLVTFDRASVLRAEGQSIQNSVLSAK